MKKTKPIAKKKPVAKKPAKTAPKKAAGATSASGGSHKKPAAKKTPTKPAAKKSAKAAPKKAAAGTTQFPRAESRGASSKKPVVKPAVKPVAKVAPKKAAAGATHASPKETKVAKVAKVDVKKAAPAMKAAAKESKHVVKEPTAKATKVSKVKGEAKVKEAAPADAFPALDANVKRPSKPFFLEVKPGVERVIKRGDKSAISQVIDLQARRKGPAAEETSDELAERIERELQSQSFLKRAPMRPQLCTKCGINAVTPRFTIDRELGYCEGCAEILHLGETKEARRMESSLAAKKEEIAPPGPGEVASEDTEEEPVPEDLD